MIFALDNIGKRIEASKGVEALCPICKNIVKAKCGIIKVHHWYHMNLCTDNWKYESMSK